MAQKKLERFAAIKTFANVLEYPSDMKGKWQVFFKNECLVLITVPSKKVDFILRVLKKFKIVDAETLHQHYGFDVKKVDEIFDNRHFKLLMKRKFQLGLNNLFVYKRIL